MAGPEKSEGAFRTIREVADWLGVPTHVLRFWESKFEQIAPVKGAGGRRYYRPDDMRLLGGIKVMLHDQGLPIRGVGQKIDDEGVEAVMALSPDLDMPDTAAAPKTRRVIRQGEDGETATVVPFGRGEKAADAPEETPRKATPGPAVPPPAEKTPPPAPKEPPPAQPGEEVDPGQLGDETTPPQPSDEPIEEPLDGAGQPDVPETERGLSKAPGPAPEPETDEEPSVHPADGPGDIAENETRPESVDMPPRETDRPLSVLPGNQRRLRRVIRKLRGLIEEVEAEMDHADDA